MDEGLDELARSRGEGEKETGGQEDEEDHGDKDVCIERSHFVSGEKNGWSSPRTNPGISNGLPNLSLCG